MKKIRLTAQLGVLLFVACPLLTIITQINIIGIVGGSIGITLLLLVSFKMRCPYCRSFFFFPRRSFEQTNPEFVKFVFMSHELKCMDCGKTTKVE